MALLTKRTAHVIGPVARSGTDNDVKDVTAWELLRWVAELCNTDVAVYSSSPSRVFILFRDASATVDLSVELCGHGSPFFNMFGYTTTLKPLTEEEDDVAWILEQSGRWPLLVQILCRERLMALEDGEADETWKEEGLAQIASFRYLLR